MRFGAIMNERDRQYLSEDDIRHCESLPPNIKDVFVSIGKQKIESMQKNYSLSKNHKLLKSEDKEELRIVVIGKTGVGKSATANTICRKQIFTEDMGANSVTSKSRCITRKIEGRRIRVIDTPGLHDTNQTEEVILTEIARVIQIFDAGIHAFLYVFNLASPRFTEEDRTTLKAIEEKFGGHMTRYRIVVYTHADNNLNENLNLESFIEIQKTSNQLIKDLLEETNGNIVAVNNKTSIPAEQKRNQDVIIAMVDQLRKMNGRHQVYTNEMFLKASEKRIELTDKILKRRWNTTLLNVLQAVYAFRGDLLRVPTKLFRLLKTRTLKVQKLSKKLEEHTLAVESSTDPPDEVKVLDKLNEVDESGDLNVSDEIEDIEFIESPEDIEEMIEDVSEEQVKVISQDIINVSTFFQSFVKRFWLKKGE